VNDRRIGPPLDRVDGRAKVLGQATYSAEVPAGSVAYGVIVGATISRGRVTAIDASEANAVPGVLAVLTHENAPRLPGAAEKKENARVVQLLQDASVAYDGQPVALVVADSLEAAQHAAALVRPTFEEEHAESRIEPVAGTAFVPKPSGPRPSSDSHRGDFDRAYEAADVRVAQRYTMPIENHNPMEPHATLAVWQGPDRLALYDATQWVFGVQQRAAQIFGIPPDNVRVVTKFVGGAFGCKGSAWSHVFLAAMGAKVTGRPVKLVLTRQQMFQSVGYRPQLVQEIALGARHDGTLVAVKHDVLSQTSRFDEFMEPAAYATRMLYACDNVRTSHRLVRIDASTPTFMRAPGESSGSYALESAMDELSYALGVDPLALRIKNYAERDLEEDKPYSSKTLRTCYEQGATRFGWTKRKRTPRATREGRMLVGWGMATATYPAHQNPASALARLQPDGTVLVQSGTMDIGTGTYTVMTQLAAEALGLPVERVRFELGDTTQPHAPIEAGSGTVSSVGSAVTTVATKLRDAVRTAASAEPTPDVYTSVARRGPIEVRHDEKEKDDRKRFSCHSFGAQFAEVRVDEDFGTVRVTRVVGAFAAGRILNAKTARSQLLGGMVWGIGMALLENTVRDEHSARVVTKDLADYHVPVHADVPDLEVIMVPDDDPHVNAIGAKGIGEIGLVGMGAAIANAVYHATGKRVRDLPITPEKLL
jgi:xanthine dehydrogenase YagR molybdenum-binding subunit